MKCPTCRRSIASSVSSCSRCGTDLELILKACAEHDRLIQNGRDALGKRNVQAARTCFHKALGIRRDSQEARKGLALAALLENDFTKALLYYSDSQE